MSNLAKNLMKSSWTPLNNEETNQKIFEERRALVVKWFEKWTDGQRKQVLGDLLEKCKVRQIDFAGNIVQKKRPVHHDDFTRNLPRVLSLYIFSFLDPRSLCRCSQVSWFWKYLTELDQMWMPKCLKLGWVLPFSPSPYETGVWKRLYVENIVALKCMTPKVAKDIQLDTDHSGHPDSTMSSRITPRKTGTGTGRPPWRGSDPVPKDIWRNNILQNDDETEKVNKLRKKGVYGKEIMDVTKRAINKVNTNLSPPKRPSTLPRSKSVSGLGDSYSNPQRPDWAKTINFGEKNCVADTSHNIGRNTDTTLTKDSMAETMKRPGPVKNVKLAGKPHRTPRDPPSSNLFPEQPWKVPDDEEYDSDIY